MQNEDFLKRYGKATLDEAIKYFDDQNKHFTVDKLKAKCDEIYSNKIKLVGVYCTCKHDFNTWIRDNAKDNEQYAAILKGSDATALDYDFFEQTNSFKKALGL